MSKNNNEIKASTPCATIPQLVDLAAARFSGTTFLEQVSDDGTKQQISFTDFAVKSRQVAAALIDKGIKPGDRVAVWAPNCMEWVLAAIGAQCAGAILVTLNTRYKGAEAAYILRKSRAKLLFSIGHFLDQYYPAMLNFDDEDDTDSTSIDLPDLKDIIVFDDKVEDTSGITETPWKDFLSLATQTPISEIERRMQSVSPSDVSDILFTSGTTGEPKGVMTGHGQNLRAFTIFSDIVGLEQGDRYLVVNPFFHSFGYKAGILACLIKGVTLLPHAVFDTSIILNRIARDKISVLPGPPTLFQSLLGHPKLDQYDLSSLKRATTGAAVIPVELIEEMKSRLGFENVITAYGLTESCGLVTACRPGDNAETIAMTSGRAIPDVEVRCVDTDNQEVPRGEPGEIVCRGFNVMQGYFENPEATEKTIDKDRWLHTGDIGIMDDLGNLRITDRLKDMFITGGFNCYPAEIEKALTRHPDIFMAAVIGVPDKRLGEVAMAFIVLNENAQLSEDALIAWCRDHMANYKVPRFVHFMEALPLNASGKVVKPTLRKQANSLLLAAKSAEVTPC